MIVSFHPCYEADVNILCAGRQPDGNDLAAIRGADAVVLPQGCREALYHMARRNGRHVFPNYDARFRYPGKTGQAGLFRETNVAHPPTWAFADTTQFDHRGPMASDMVFPLVFKLDWGGEGETVFLLRSMSDLKRALAKAAAHERTGQKGFILQTLVPNAQRSLRVVVIGKTLKAYWRIQDDPTVFGTSLGYNARIDTDASPELRRRAMAVAERFCQQTRINLAGLDFIFDESVRSAGDSQPLLLEINYFFGRTGLGGSASYYTMLQAEIDRWLAGIGLAAGRGSSPSEARDRS